MEEHGRHCKSWEVHHRQRYCVSGRVSRVNYFFSLWPCFFAELLLHSAPSGNTEFDVLASGRAVICSSKSSISFGDIGPSSPSPPSTNRRRGRALNERIVKNYILWHRHRRRSQ